MSSHIKTLISLLESLPLDMQQKVVEHLQEYIKELEKELNLENRQKPPVLPENNQIIDHKNETFAELSPEEIEILNHCTEYPVWTLYDSFL
jgi:hypothetical protein